MPCRVRVCRRHSVVAMSTVTRKREREQGKGEETKDPSPRYVKFIRRDRKHYGVRYKEGIVEDPLPFDPDEHCGPGGLFFAKVEDAAQWASFGDDMATITIPPGERVVEFKQKLKAHRIRVGKIVPIGDHPVWNDSALRLAAVRKTPWLIEHMKNPSEALQMTAVGKDAGAVLLIEDPCRAAKVLALTLDGNLIEYMKDLDDELQVIAVTKSPEAIYAIDNPCEEAIIAAACVEPCVMGSFPNASDRVKETVIKRCPEAVYWMNNLSEDLKLWAIKRNPYCAFLVAS